MCKTWDDVKLDCKIMIKKSGEGLTEEKLIWGVERGGRAALALQEFVHPLLTPNIPPLH